MLELWVETKTDDGKFYFYNACTRETTWSKPEGPNVKIISQSEIEAMNQNPMALGPNPTPMIDLQATQNQTSTQSESKNGTSYFVCFLSFFFH